MRKAWTCGSRDGCNCALRTWVRASAGANCLHVLLLLGSLYERDQTRRGHVVLVFKLVDGLWLVKTGARARKTVMGRRSTQPAGSVASKGLAGAREQRCTTPVHPHQLQSSVDGVVHGLDAFVDGPEVDGVVPQELPKAPCTLGAPAAPVRAAPGFLSRLVHESRRPSIPASARLRRPGARDERGGQGARRVRQRQRPASGLQTRRQHAPAARAVRVRNRPVETRERKAWLQHHR